MISVVFLIRIRCNSFEVSVSFLIVVLQDNLGKLGCKIMKEYAAITIAAL